MQANRLYLLAFILALCAVLAHTESYGPDDNDMDSVNDDDDFNNYKIPEPYKSLLESGARFALAQTPLTRKLDAGLAIEAVQDLIRRLLHTSTLLLLAKVTTVVLLGIGASSTIFPDGRLMLETVWNEHNQMRVNQVLSSFAGGTTMSLLSMSSDAMLRKFGLHEEPCRRLTLCRMGQRTASILAGLDVPKSVHKLAASLFNDKRSSISDTVSAYLDGLIKRKCPADSRAASFCAASLLS